MMKTIIITLPNDCGSLQWEWNEGADEATCLFYTEIQKNTLRDIVGINVGDSAITITELQTFIKSKNHSFSVLPEDKRRPSFPGCSFFLPLPEKNISQDERSPGRRKQSSPRFTPRERSSIPSTIHGELRIDSLILLNTTLWSDTLAYEAYFEQKTKTDCLEREYRSIKSETQIIIEHQYKINDRLYPKKAELIKKIRYFFDELLVPAFEELPDQCVSDELRQYFQDAIQNIMLTTLDKRALKKNANNNTLAPFLFFINSHNPLPDSLSEPTRNLLNLLKGKLSHNPAIKTTFKQLKKLKTEINTIQHELIEEQRVFDLALKDHKDQNEFYSFYRLLKESTNKKFNSTTLQILFTKILSEISSFSNLNALRAEMSIVRGGETDLFISKQLYLVIKTTFENLSKSNLLKKIKEPASQTKIVDVVMSTIKLYIDNNVSNDFRCFNDLLTEYFIKYDRIIKKEQLSEIIKDCIEQIQTLEGTIVPMKGDKYIYFETQLYKKISEKLYSNECLAFEAKNKDPDLESTPIQDNDFLAINKMITDLVSDTTTEWVNEKRQEQEQITIQEQIDEVCGTTLSSLNSSSSSSSSSMSYSS